MYDKMYKGIWTRHKMYIERHLLILYLLQYVKNGLW